MVFRNENKVTESRANRVKSPRDATESAIYPTTDDSSSRSSLDFLRIAPSDFYHPEELKVEVGRLLPQSFEQAALQYFFSEWIVIPNHQGTPNFIEHLLPMYNEVKSKSALSPIVSAIALAALSSKLDRSAVRDEATRNYTEAISMLKMALCDPVEAKSDYTLLTVILFGLYESMTCTSKSVVAWAKHNEGAVALLKLRGKEMLHSPVSTKFYRFVRNQMVISHITRCAPIEPLFSSSADWIKYPEDLGDNFMNKLNAATIKIPKVRAIGIKILRDVKNEDTFQQVTRLMEEAEQIDQELAAWPVIVPSSWKTWPMPAVRCSLTDIRSAEFWADSVDGYLNLWAVVLWNSYRTFRIFVQALILNCAEWLAWPVRSNNSQKYRAAAFKLQTLIDEICASVPYSLGYQGPSTRKPNFVSDIYVNNTPNPDQYSIGRGSAALGGYFLIWPLFVAHSVVCIPQLQKEWIKNRLDVIGKRYALDQARVLSMIEEDIIIKSAGERIASITDFAPALSEFADHQPGLVHNPLFPGI